VVVTGFDRTGSDLRDAVIVSDTDQLPTLIFSTVRFNAWLWKLFWYHFSRDTPTGRNGVAFRHLP
jgi:hypothetical protein